jgi:hypothetical protein
MGYRDKHDNEAVFVDVGCMRCLEASRLCASVSVGLGNSKDVGNTTNQPMSMECMSHARVLSVQRFPSKGG